MRSRLLFCFLLMSACGERSSSRTFDSWSDVADHLDREYQLAERTSDHVKLVFEYESNRLQAVIVSHFEALGHPGGFVDFASAVGPVGDADAPAYMQQSYGLAVGSFALDGENLVVRGSVPLRDLTTESLELYLHVVASTADKAEATRGRDEY